MIWRERITTACFTNPRTDCELAPIFAEPAIPEALARVGRELKLTLPAELRALLLESNGVSLLQAWAGRPNKQARYFSSTHELLENNRSLRTELDVHDGYASFAEWLFFAGEPDGDQYGYWLPAGAKTVGIYRWDHDDDDRRLIAPTLVDFIAARYATPASPLP